MVLKGIFLDRASLDYDDLTLTQLQATLPHWQMPLSTRAEEVGVRIQGATVVISNKVPLTASGLRQQEALKLICVAATGTNNVDVQAAVDLGISVCNVRGYATASVVSHVFTLMLALTSHLPEYQAAVAAGEWENSTQFCLLKQPPCELQGLVLGIVGYGELGQAVAAVARAFGMKVLISARPGTPAGVGRIAFSELLGQVDILSLHCPLTAKNSGLISAQALARMKPEAILINTARGGLVDEDALAAALQAGRLGGAGLDVLATEPPSVDNPLRKLSHPRLLITPHIAWASRAARQRLVDEITLNIRAFLVGKARNLVQPD